MFNELVDFLCRVVSWLFPLRGSVVPAGVGKFPIVFFEIDARDWLKLLNNEIRNRVN